MNEIVFLGIFDKIANWIFSGVSKALTWLVSNIIAPVCSAIWENFLVYIWELLSELVSVILYKIYAFILTVLYAVESAIYSFAGARDVTYNGESGSILSIFTSMDGVKTAFVYITCISLVLLFLFTVVAVMKTTIDFGYDGRKSAGTIMTTFITSCVTFLILPVFCYGLMDLSARCMTALFKATSMSGGMSITDNLYLMSIRSSVGTGTDAISTSSYNSLMAQMQATEMFWYNLSDVKPYIVKASNVDYIVGVIGALVLIINLLGMAAVFIQRILEVILLYIVSPFFVSTMPLDDGARFNRWRNTFIGRLSMGIGMIVALNIVMMILSVVITGSDGYTITFASGTSYTSNSTANSLINSSLDILLKLVFMIGAIMSVKQAGITLTSIIDRETAGVERFTAHEGKQFVMSSVHRASGALRSAGRSSSSAGRRESEKTQSQRPNAMAQYTQKASVSEGFKGDVANKRELDFTKALRSVNRSNSISAAFTKRGGKYAAINDKIEEGNNMLSRFKGLKTHEEREQFMTDLKNRGGLASLKVDETKFGLSQMTSVNESRRLHNLDRRMAITRENRDNFKEGSEQWNKYNDRLKSMSSVRKEFDALNTHGERADFISKHSEFSDIAGRTSEDKKAAENLSRNIDFTKQIRDTLPINSEEWKSANGEYNSLKERLADFSEPMSAEEKSRFMEENKSNFEVPAKERRKEMLEEAKCYANIIITRDMFDKDSDDWNKYNAELQKGDSAFKKQAVLSGKEKKSLDNINKGMTRIKSLRDAASQGSSEREIYNDRLSAMAAAKMAFENPNTTKEDRAILLNNNKDMFEDPDSERVTEAMGILNSRITAAEQNRNMFKEGSEEWKVFDNQVNDLKQKGTALQIIPSKEAREAYVKNYSSVFAKPEDMRFRDAVQMKSLDNNIARAQQNRDRHRQGSEGWQKCDGELQSLKSLKAQFSSLGTSEEKNSFAEKNSRAFSDSLRKDKNLKALENGYKNWSGIEGFARNPEAKEHAHKMAGSYRGLSEEYQRADTDEARKAVMDKAKVYENLSVGGPETKEGKYAAAMGGDVLTPKEYEGISKVLATGNEPAIARYVNTKSHSERSQILKNVEAGEYKRLTIPNKRETDFRNSLVTAGASYLRLAETAALGTGEAERYEALSSFCSQAAERYDGLAHHVQREKFAGFVTREINSASQGLEGLPKTPEMAPYDQKTPFSEPEQLAADIWFSGREDIELEDTYKYKQRYYEAENTSRRERTFQDYASYSSTAEERTRIGAEIGIDTEGLSARPAPKYTISRYNPEDAERWSFDPNKPLSAPGAEVELTSTPAPAAEIELTPTPAPVAEAELQPAPAGQAVRDDAAAAREERRKSVNIMLSSRNSGNTVRKKYVSRLAESENDMNSGKKNGSK
ncbi:MAG: hypothetical protein LUD81_11285 [Clostridiales bacterium]|nr:hypothetical protein [Clostridiales bacterium]